MMTSTSMDALGFLLVGEAQPVKWVHQFVENNTRAPPILDGHLVITAPRAALLPMGFAHAAEDSVPVEAEKVEVAFRVAEANVCTLCPRDLPANITPGMEVTARMEELQRAFAELGAAMVAILESRIKGQCIRRMRSYHAICTGCDRAGGHGIELWLSTEHPVLVGGQECFLNTRAATVLH